ncbi:tryptophan 7-halogenase [Microbispora sp. RL4-1S]|uniref:Tryptophan 7-halogenase n=1 Tax=Microbispora oryzae TaxID=2806554 RepID=A0A940WM92_9ACTN|nr:tryptophan 7-halogenase [Microbispora oryzae]MBP2708259.1 tryptophan 7-halogenase [Microbispora oryzae]
MFDVIILGSGIAGSILGSILARNGASVLLIDAGVHPRFAVGESTISHTLNVFRMLAERYEVPELEALISYDKGMAEIGPSMGIKRHFGFMLHQEGREPDPGQASQFGTAGIGHLQTSHLFRQDTDAYLFHAAIGYGCTARQAFRVTDVELNDDSVAVVGANGERFTGRYLVDASGFRSPVAGLLGLREEPCPLKHHSRSLFTHMIGVRPTDDCLMGERPAVPWVEGTMHHLFERGWFWIIPFNNDPRSVNPLVSVGLTFDERVYPKPSDISPEEEFYRHVARFPLLERIFADASTVRPWVSTDRLQYSSSRTVGARWCLMSHAAGFLDPLYSRGLSNTGEVINALAWRLLEALRDDDFAEERFEYVDTLQKGLIRYNDDLVNSSFVSWSHPDLWNAVSRVWAGAQMPVSMHFGQAVEKFRQSRDDAIFRDLERLPYPGSPFPGNAAYNHLFADMVRICDAVDAGERDAGEAGVTLMKTVAESPGIVPFLGLQDPETRLVQPSLETFISMARWLATEGPEDMRYLADNPRFAHLLAAPRT